MSYSEDIEYAADELNGMNVFELRSIASLMGISGVRRYRKDELIQRILDSQEQIDTSGRRYGDVYTANGQLISGTNSTNARDIGGRSHNRGGYGTNTTSARSTSNNYSGNRGGQSYANNGSSTRNSGNYGSFGDFRGGWNSTNGRRNSGDFSSNRSNSYSSTLANGNRGGYNDRRRRSKDYSPSDRWMY